ncbi:Mu-like prophage major head subunit gpT family protein [Sphingomonas sp. AR_OL41]|uniref:Mu-like prophage major head subunit gpT family protein n=1 Tax=Sphingomonas sp. AR_OL41 TaxID=3042729 RepID=UPI002481206B|nr:Mu-like prophage major head subunit gpT family protein [Sphingomonas sp. AR_OL41]MDH7971775.1 Mu-like prophage major head subunit gpT family protein [Sphingomonas sp. AR_OL41]
MLITAAALQALRTAFNNKFKDGRTKAKPKLTVLATPVTSSTAIETYGFLSEMPAFRKWVGDKRIKSIAERAYQLINDDYEASVGIKRKSIQDDNLGLYPSMFEGWGMEAELWPDRLLAAALASGNTLPCFDNQNFFDTLHPNFDEAGSTYSNNNTIGTVQPWYLVDLSKPLKPLIMQKREEPHFWMTTNPEDTAVAETGRFGAWGEARGAAGYTMPFLAYRSTAAITAASYVAARDAMAAYVDDVGDPRGIVPTHIVYGVSNRAAAEDLFKKMNLAGGESNVHWNAVECLFAERLP